MRNYGAREPAMIPVLREERLYFSGLPSYTRKYSENIVGTPYMAVHLYFDTASKAIFGSNPSQTKVCSDPLVAAAKLPRIIPKQWYIGTGIQILSS
jgi:hypothetical protein